jgi:hypothetical protein
MIQHCDTTQVRPNLDFGVKFSAIQFYIMEYNFKSNHWIELELY